jgi:hypothetical protein
VEIDLRKALKPIALTFAFLIVGIFGIQVATIPRISVDMSTDTVRRDYGEPAERVKQMTLSISPAGGFVYTEMQRPGATAVQQEIPASKLPPIPHEAWYYPYGILGTTCVLVYVSSEGKVLRVFHGGT